MSKVKPLSKANLKQVDLIIKIAQKNMGFTPNSLTTLARNPAILGSFGMLTANIIGKDGAVSPLQGIRLAIKNLIWTVKNLKNKKRVSLALKNLVAYVSSNAAGCRYCQAHTINEAYHNGVAIEKIEAVWDFENSPLFDDAERAALRFSIAASTVPNTVTEKHFEALRKFYTEEQIVDIGATIALFGFLNRWNDTFATQLEDEPFAFAKKHLEKSGWEIGKHE